MERNRYFPHPYTPPPSLEGIVTKDYHHHFRCPEVPIFTPIHLTKSPQDNHVGPSITIVFTDKSHITDVSLCITWKSEMDDCLLG